MYPYHMWVYPPRYMRDTWTNQLVESTGEADKADPCTYQLVQSTGEANRLIYGPTSWYICIYTQMHLSICEASQEQHQTQYIYIYIYIYCVLNRVIVTQTKSIAFHVPSLDFSPALGFLKAVIHRLCLGGFFQHT